MQPNPGIEAAALGASESALPGTAPAEPLHTFTLDLGASHCFLQNSTTLTPLPAPVPLRLADPSWGPVLARSSAVLPCLAVPSGSLSGLHLPSFSTNLVSTAALQDAMVTTTTPGGRCMSICTSTRTGRHLATFTRRPGSSLYTLTTEPLQVAASAQVSASGPVVAPCMCRLLSHQTLLWHHRLGHPSLPRLRGMHSRLLVSGLPRSLPPLLPSPAPPCLPCIEGQQRAAPHSSFPPMTAPLQTLHIDVWGPARVSGHDRECYFLLVVDDYTRYTTVFPLCSKGEDLHVLCLHFDRGGEFSSDLLQEFCHGEGILQSFTLPASPQKNGVAERRIGLVMEVARTSMIHAAAPCFLWLFAVRYAAHQLNMWPRVSLPETSPTLRWTGKVSDASVFRVWGSRGFFHDTSADKLSSPAIPCVFLGFPPDAPGWQFFHPIRAVSSPLRTSRPPPIDPLTPHGPAPSGVSQVDPLPLAPEGAEPGGTEPEGAEAGGAESKGAESGGAEPRGTASAGGPAGAPPRLSHRQEPLSPQQLREWFPQRTRVRSGTAGAGGSAIAGTRFGGAGVTSLGGAGVTAGAGGIGGAGAAGLGAARSSGTRAARAGGVGGSRAGDPRAGGTGAGDPGAGGTGAGGAGAGGTGAEEVLAAGPGGARTRGTGAAGVGAGGARAGDPGDGGTGAGGAGAGGNSTGGTRARGNGAGDPGAGGAGDGGAGAGGLGVGGTVQQRPFLIPLPPSSLLPPDSVLRQVLNSLTERREPESCPALPVCAVHTSRCVPCPRPPPVPGPHITELCPSSVPLRVPLPSPLTSSLPDVLDPESNLARAASPTVPRILATVVTDPSLESTSASALVADLVDFAAACRLEYATILVAASESKSPLFVEGEGQVWRRRDYERRGGSGRQLKLLAHGATGATGTRATGATGTLATGATGTRATGVTGSAANSELQEQRTHGRLEQRAHGRLAQRAHRRLAQRSHGRLAQRSSCEAEIYAGAMVAGCTGVMLAHLPVDQHGRAASFFSSSQRGQLRLAYVATRANTVDIFTKAIQSGDHQRFCTVLGLFELMMEGTQTHGFFDGSLPYPTHGTQYDKQQYTYLGFAPLTADPSLLLYTDTSLSPFYILVYVNNLVFATANTDALALVKSKLQKRHTCTDLGELCSYLGLQISKG
ncbi:unnamed protein product [Closterium sp. NIES-53]